MGIFSDNIEVVEQAVTVSGPTVGQAVMISAPTGKKVLSGGFHDSTSNVGVRYSYPSSDGLSWHLEVFTNASGTFSTTASAVCLG
jgi:hypothetical protein